MTDTTTKSFTAKRAVLVSRYATPLAVLLVVLGLFCSQPVGLTRQVSIDILIFSVIFNLVSTYFFKRYEASAWMVKVRMAINVAMNSILVYFLENYWDPIWLLLALTPVATAVYGTRRETALSAGGISIILLAIQATRQFNSPLDWGQQIARISFIVVLSFMINELANLTRKS